MRYVFLAAVALCLSCDFALSLGDDRTVLVPKDCGRVESAYVLEPSVCSELRCVVICNDLRDSVTVYIGDCSPKPTWKVVRFARYAP